MPDRHGFNHLGQDVRCIEDGCDAGGPLHEWPERKRARHQAAHERARETRRLVEASTRLRRYRRELARERALQRRAGLE